MSMINQTVIPSIEATQLSLTLPNGTALNTAPFPTAEGIEKIYEEFLQSFKDPLQAYISDFKNKERKTSPAFATLGVARKWLLSTGYFLAIKTLIAYNPKSEVINQAMQLAVDFLQIHKDAT